MRRLFMRPPSVLFQKTHSHLVPLPTPTLTLTRFETLLSTHAAKTLKDHKPQYQALNGDADEHENQAAKTKVETEEQQPQKWKNCNP